MYFKFILAISEKNEQFDRRKSTKYDYKTTFNGNLETILKFNRKDIKKPNLLFHLQLTCNRMDKHGFSRKPIYFSQIEETDPELTDPKLFRK